MIVERRWEHWWIVASDKILGCICLIERYVNKFLISIEKLQYLNKTEYTLDEVNIFAEQICKRMGVEPIAVQLTDILPSHYRMHDPYNLAKALAYGSSNLIFINQLQAWQIGIPIEMVVAHEIRHYYQNVTGRMSVEYFGPTWDGSLVHANWYDSPWEADAVEYENKVAIELGLPISRIVVDGKVYDHGNRKATRS